MKPFVMNCEKAQVYNEFFLASCSLDDEQMPKPDANGNVERTLLHVVITEKYIGNLLTSLDITKAIDPDQISQIMLKEAGAIIVPSFF